MWALKYEKAAFRTLRDLDGKTRKRLVDRIEALAKNPKAPNNNVKKLQGVEGYRLRVGDWRIVYRLQDRELVIVVIDIGQRKEIYR